MRVKLSGGYHNSDEIVVNVPETRDIHNIKFLLPDLLTEYQEKRLSKHFCGIKGCTCGSWTRASVEVI